MAVGTITSDRCWQRDDGATGHRRWWQMQEVVTVRDDCQKLGTHGGSAQTGPSSCPCSLPVISSHSSPIQCGKIAFMLWENG
jgi:hypothetical protein